MFRVYLKSFATLQSPGNRYREDYPVVRSLSREPERELIPSLITGGIPHDVFTVEKLWVKKAN